MEPNIFYKGHFIYVTEIFRRGRLAGFGALVLNDTKEKFCFACGCDMSSEDPELGVVACAMEEIDRRTK